MKDAIEPSEIFTRTDFEKQSSKSIPDPGKRFLARFVDYSIYLWILWGLRIALKGYFPYRIFEFFIPFEYFSFIPIEALLLSTFGMTFGKWFLGIKLIQKHSSKMSFESSLRRSFNVWFRGLGLAIPIFGFFAMVFAYNRFKIFGTTTWDLRENIQVVYEKIEPWRVWAAGIFIVLSFFVYYFEKYSH